MPNTAAQQQGVTGTPSLTGESFGSGPDAVPVLPLLEALQNTRGQLVCPIGYGSNQLSPGHLVAAFRNGSEIYLKLQVAQDPSCGGSLVKLSDCKELLFCPNSKIEC
jgi:hypothetical protein